MNNKILLLVTVGIIFIGTINSIASLNDFKFDDIKHVKNKYDCESYVWDPTELEITNISGGWFSFNIKNIGENWAHIVNCNVGIEGGLVFDRLKQFRED